MKLLSLFLSIVLTALFVGCSSSPESQTYYLVRHAEKDTTDKTENPPLIPEGYERAERLAEVLDTVDIDLVLSTKYDRNINTVQPLIDKKEVDLEIYEWYDWHANLDQLMKKGGVFLICGHGDNLLPMIEQLGGEKPQQSLDHHEYDKLFKVTRDLDGVDVEVILF